MLPTSNSTALTLDAAQALLRQFTCRESPAERLRQPTSSEALPDHETTRQALLLVREHSDYQIFGICADTLEQAAISLSSYLTALGYQPAPNFPAQDGSVYLKYNPNTERGHVDGYTGTYRGVLVSCQSAYEGDVKETFGHLPLELFS